jgi:hypothetical protein
MNEEVAKEWAKVVKQTMEEAPASLKSIFGIDFKLPLPVEVKIGKNWGELKKLDI